MAILSNANISELKDNVGVVALLLYMNLRDSSGNDAEYYFNNSNNDLYINGQKYITMPFDIEDFDTAAGLVSNDATLKFDNVSLFPASVFLNTDHRGRPAEIGLGIFDKNFQCIGNALLWGGFITRYDVNELTANITIAHDFVFWRKYTLKKYSYEDFPTLKDMDEKQIWWGRTPK